MVCPQCRAENPADSAFCGACGRALAERAPSPHYLDRVALLRRELVILAFGVVLLLAAAFGAWYALFYQRSPAMIVRGFIEADRAGDFALEQQYVSNQWDSRVVLGILQAFRKQTGVSPFQSYRILDSSVSGQTAIVSVEITVTLPNRAGTGPLTTPGVNPPATGQNVLPITFTLLRENNEWRIDAAQTAMSVTGVLMALGYQQLGPYLPNLAPPGNLPPFSNPLPPPSNTPPSAPAPAAPTPPGSGGTI